MNRLIRRTAAIFGGVVLLAVIIGFGTSVYAEVKIGRNTSRTVRQVVNSTFRNDDFKSAGQELDRLVVQRSSPESDEAAVILLDYYVGEHNDEELLISLTQRGSGVLPRLIKYRDHPAPAIRPWFWPVRKHGVKRYDEVMRYIREGKVLSE
jgi:hypothetical protein